MWLSSKWLDLFSISKETIDQQREELAMLRAERTSLQTQLASATANFNWITTRVNSLEYERAELLKRAYNIDIPVPEIVRKRPNPLELESALFEDMGDAKAKELGFPVYGDRN